jgi:hypothetical protein
LLSLACPGWPPLPDLAALSLDQWAAIAQLVLAAIALAALVGAFIQLRDSRSTTRQTLTYNFTARFSSPELLQYNQMTRDLFQLGNCTEDEGYERYLNRSFEDQLAVLIVPNLIEELAGMYNQGLLHRGIAKDYFGFTAQELWNEGWWFIKRFREADENFYAQWLLMLEDMEMTPDLS